MSDEDSPPRRIPRRNIKKVVVVSSSSETESDSSDIPISSRKKRLRVLSDDGGNSSDSSIIGSGARKKLPRLKDSDTSDASDDSDTSHRTFTIKSKTLNKTKVPSGFTSDSSEGSSEKCSICLMRFTNQQIGIPGNCEHIFCFDCITEWSKNVNTCPVDRIRFDKITVRSHLGGKVIRSDNVRVVERRSSVELMVVEDTTVCQICGQGHDEERMLLCDGCNFGFHMQCLTPPLTEIPASEWYCPNCAEIFNGGLDTLAEELRYLSDLLLSDVVSEDELDFNYGVHRDIIALEELMDEPSTSTGRVPRSNRRAVNSRPNNASRGRPTRRATSYRRKRSRRRAKTVIIEYEVNEGGKFPVTKRVKRKVKRRKLKRRQPRTVARRNQVRQSVRAKLATLNERQQLSSMSSSQNELIVTRQRAGVPSLNLFGDPNQLDYFEDDEESSISEGATSVVATRPTSHILSAYRQARRKMITIPSPAHASPTPDLLSDILESQTLLHSNKSIISVSVDGQVDIKLRTKEKAGVPKNNVPKSNKEDEVDKKIDLNKADEHVKKVPSYPGQSRSGGGWGGGYRGNYGRDQSNNINRPNNESIYGGFQSRQGNNLFNQNMRGEDLESFGDSNFPRRVHRFPINDNFDMDRSRRQDFNRGPNYPPQRPNEPNRYSTGPSWQSYENNSGPRHAAPPPQSRHSFGGFENPLDMRMGQIAPRNSSDFRSKNILRDLPTIGLQPQTVGPLPEPPMFDFDRIPHIEKSEDEKSDPGLTIDTEKYDPMEPTLDEDSGDEKREQTIKLNTNLISLSAEPVPNFASPESSNYAKNLTGISTAALNVPPQIMDYPASHILPEHRNVVVPPSIQTNDDKSDDDSDGDCPNFSIYSATSVHIASNPNVLENAMSTEPANTDLEDLIQEDDEPIEPITSDATVKVVPASANESFVQNQPSLKIDKNDFIKNKSEEELKEKVSKRCPITVNTRNPIKIKLNTSSLIKRQLSLYDDEDVSVEAETKSKYDSVDKTEKRQKQENNFQGKEIQSDDKKINVNPELLIAKKDSESDKVSSNTKDLKSVKVSEEKSVDLENDHNSLDVGETLDSVMSEEEIQTDMQSPHANSNKKELESVEKLTESISETEDERSYTPCLDENKSKDTSLEAEKDMGIEGLGTEMISEEEENDMFLENDNELSDNSHASGVQIATAGEEGEIVDKAKAKTLEKSEVKKKKRKESKKVSKEKTKSKSKKSDITFKKISKSSKERNYRDKGDKDRKKDQKDSNDLEKEKQKQKRKEKRKDLERYDVRTVVTEKKVKTKDAFGRDISPAVKSRSRSRSRVRDRSISRPRRSTSGQRQSLNRLRGSLSRQRRSLSRPRRSPSRSRRSMSRPHQALDKTRRSMSRNRKSYSRPRSIDRFRRSMSRQRRSISRRRRSISRLRRSPSRSRRNLSGERRTFRALRSVSRGRLSPVPRGMRSVSRRRLRSSSSRRNLRRSISARSPSLRGSPFRHSSAHRKSGLIRKRRKSVSPRRKSSPRKRRSTSPVRKRLRKSSSRSVKPKGKKKKRSKSEKPSPREARKGAPRRKSPKRKKVKRRSVSRSRSPVVAPQPAWSPLSVDSRLLSPCTPPPDFSPPPERLEHLPIDDKRKRKEKRRKRDTDSLQRPKKSRESAGPCKEVFTSGDNILVSVSFKDQDRDMHAAGGVPTERRRRKADGKREKKKRRKRPTAGPVGDSVKPVAIIDLERSPFRELTPSPKNVIVLSDSDHAEKEKAPTPMEVQPATEPQTAGPKTPPEPAVPAPEPELAPEEPEVRAGPNTPPDPPDSPDAYDPFEPTRSASASPQRDPSPSQSERPSITLETAQKTNLSADDVLDRRPLSPIEKVMALLQSTRDITPEPPPPPQSDSQQPAPTTPVATPAADPAPATSAPRIVLPSPTRTQPPKLFLAKPSPIKSNPVKPMQATKISKLPLPAMRRGLNDLPDLEESSPYSPGSSDYGELFDPPTMGKRDIFDSLFGSKPKSRKSSSTSAKVPVKLNKKKGKTQVGVKIDEDNLKVLDDLPSSAVEMQVKSKFLKKLNRQERVVEEVKLVLKPHYNKKHVTKEEYKEILRRAVPKICHNKTGEINPTKIQSLVEAYVKKYRKKHKLGLA